MGIRSEVTGWETFIGQGHGEPARFTQGAAFGAGADCAEAAPAFSLARDRYLGIPAGFASGLTLDG